MSILVMNSYDKKEAVPLQEQPPQTISTLIIQSLFSVSECYRCSSIIAYTLP